MGSGLPTAGHAPGHLRDAFTYGVQAYSLHWPAALLDEQALVWFDDDRAAWWASLTADQRAHWLTGQLWNCTDILPGGDCESLGLPHGSTYAQAARLIRRTTRP
jgi:hypothetical protein